MILGVWQLWGCPSHRDGHCETRPCGGLRGVEPFTILTGQTPVAPRPPEGRDHPEAGAAAAGCPGPAARELPVPLATRWPRGSAGHPDPPPGPPARHPGALGAGRETEGAACRVSLNPTLRGPCLGVAFPCHDLSEGGLRVDARRSSPLGDTSQIPEHPVPEEHPGDRDTGAQEHGSAWVGSGTQGYGNTGIWMGKDTEVQGRGSAWGQGSPGMRRKSRLSSPDQNVLL